MAIEAEEQVPDKLYQQYRFHRFNNIALDAYFSEQAAVNSEQSRHEVKSAESKEMDLANKLFARYKSTPENVEQSRVSAIDSIMQQIAIDQARERLLAKHFQPAVEIKTDPDAIKSVMDTKNTNVLDQLFSLPSNLLATLLNSIRPDSTRTWVPAAAFAVLAVLIIPVLIKQPSESAKGLPQQLAEATALPIQVFEFSSRIEQSPMISTTGTFGFIRGATPQASRFKLGQHAANLAISISAKGLDGLDTAQWAHSDTSVVTDDTAVSNILLQLTNAVNQKNTELSIERLAALDNAVASYDADDNLYSWFRMGQVIEALYVSTEIAIADDNLKPLEASLNQFMALEALPDEDQSQPIQRQLTQLRQFAQVNEFTLADAQKIRQSVRIIRALMIE